MDLTPLAQHLEKIARECRKAGRASGHRQSSAYGIAVNAIIDLARDIRRTKPRRTRRRSNKHYGHATLALLTEKYVGPARVSIMALQDGEQVMVLKWPEDTTQEEFQKVSQITFYASEEFEFSKPISESLYCLGIVIGLIARCLPATIDYRRPEFCNICFKHTDPDSESKHCLDHLRSSRTRPSTKYKRGHRQVKIATRLIKEREVHLSMRQFYEGGKDLIVNGTTAQFASLIKQHCPNVGQLVSAEMANMKSIRDMVRALGEVLKDPFLPSWLDYVDRRYKALQPDPVFDPTRIQIKDPDFLERGLNVLQSEWIDHICEWIVMAEIHARAATLMPKRGRPAKADSKSAEVRRRLAEDVLSREEIAAAVGVSLGLVHRIARESNATDDSDSR